MGPSANRTRLSARGAESLRDGPGRAQGRESAWPAENAVGGAASLGALRSQDAFARGSARVIVLGARFAPWCSQACLGVRGLTRSARPPTDTLGGSSLAGRRDPEGARNRTASGLGSRALGSLTTSPGSWEILAPLLASFCSGCHPRSWQREFAFDGGGDAPRGRFPDFRPRAAPCKHSQSRSQESMAPTRGASADSSARTNGLELRCCARGLAA